MDEQTTEPIITPPDAVTVNPTVEAQQAEPELTVSEPVSIAQSTKAVPPSEPIAEVATAQMAGNEPLTESTPEPVPSTVGPQGSLPFSKTEDRQENLVATAEAPQSEAPASTQGSTTTPQPTPASAPASMPAQAPVVATSPRTLARVFLEKAQAVIQQRKNKKLLKIMSLFEKKKHITNDEVEKLLHVSDATATRYLSHLEKQGKIMQTGKTGHAVSYTKI